MNWDQWFDEVIAKAAPKLVVESRMPEEREIQPRRHTAKPSAVPQRRLSVPPKSGHRPPAGRGWHRTPNGWARGDGDSYEWKPLA